MASSAEQQLEQAKATRNTAHRAFHTKLAQINEDLTARGIGGRLADRAGEAVADAAEVANEHRGVVAGTIAALVLWLLRRPLFAWVSRLWPGSDEQDRDELERDGAERKDDDD